MRSKPLAVTLAALAAVLAAVAALARRRSSGGATAPAADVGVPPPVTLDVEAAETTFTCECGHELRRTGEGRHTVYWELDADPGDPLLQSVCPNCERPLPSEHVAREA